MACSLAVLLQETGKVVNAPYRISYALRASPLICAIDTFLMLLKFLVMLLVGCSPRTAIRHVWYDRFVEDEDIGDGSWVVWVWRNFSRKVLENDTTENDPSQIVAPQIDMPPVDAEACYTCSCALPGHDSEEIRLADVQQPTTISASETVVPTPIATRRDSLDPISASRKRSRTLPIVRNDRSAMIGLSANHSPEFSAILIRHPTQPSTVVTSGVNQIETIVTQGFERPDGGDVAAARPSVSIVHEEQSPNNAIDRAPDTVELHLDRPSPSEHSATYMTALPGCAVDRSWRLSMVSFIFGAVPQAVKIFAMRGIPATQITVAILLSSFVTAEVFRSIAGPVGVSNLHEGPAVLRYKRLLSSTHLTNLAIIVSYFHLTLFTFILVLLVVPGPPGSGRGGVFAYGISVCLAVTSWVSNRVVDVLESYVFPEAFTAYVKDISLRTSRYRVIEGMRRKLTLFVPNSFMLGPCRAESHIPYFVIFPGIFVCISWVYWRFTALIDTFRWSLIAGFIFPAFVMTPACVLILLHTVYYAIFASSLANYIRYICGVYGTLDGFATGTFILVNLGLTLFLYSVTSGFDSDSTFKPGWTDTLG